MKKIFLFLMLIPVTLFAGEWSKVFVEADELVGNPSYDQYVYRDGGNSFVFRTDKPDQFYIVGPNMFDTFYDKGRTFCKVRIGLYDENGKMVDSFDMYLGARNNLNTIIGTFDCDFMSQPVGQQKKTRKIFSLLRGSVGYVRFVTDTYAHGRYDLRVYPIE